MAKDTVPGLVEAGNIDLTTRPVVKNPDGTYSTVKSISVEMDGDEILIPTVSNDGRLMTPHEAIAEYMATGQHLGKFKDVKSANRYAEQLHKSQEQMYKQKAGE